MVTGMSFRDLFQIQVRIPHELHESLLTVAASETRTVRAVVVRALEREVELSQKKASPKKKTKAA